MRKTTVGETKVTAFQEKINVGLPPPMKTAVFVYADNIERQIGWRMCSIDAFYNNLDCWRADGVSDVDALFVEPVEGVKTETLGTPKTSLVIYGSKMTKEFVADVADRLITLGFRVIEMDAKGKLLNYRATTKQICSIDLRENK